MSIAKYVKEPWRLPLMLQYRGLGKMIPDSLYLKCAFRNGIGRKLNLSDPKSFNEKLQWLKLYDRKPEYTQMVDKYGVRDYISKTIGEQYLIPLIGVWDCVEDIDFSTLPDRFVLKVTHDSGGLSICHNKGSFDYDKACNKINQSLKNDYFLQGREWPYKHVTPRIIAEKYMEDREGKGDLTDYKLHFFSGECKAVMVGQNRFGPNGLDNDYYTPEWKHFDFTRGTSHNAPERSPRPEQLDEMIRLGKVLAKDYPFVRIDFYLINGDIYFGEITFYPASGFNPFHPETWDDVFGAWIKLPQKKKRGR